MSSLPPTIKAVRQPDPRYQSLTLSDIPLPTLSSPDQRLIRVRTAAPCLHELTWELSTAAAFADAPDDRLRVPCTECAGVVVEAPGAEGDGFRPGDEVFFRIGVGSVGCLREYTVARTSELALKPKSLSWEQAAATPLSALTAWQGLFNHSEGLLSKEAVHGDTAAREQNSKTTVLITGAAGGVGSWAVQLAAAAGAGRIIAACGPSNIDAVKRLGATDTIDYTAQSIADWVAQDPANPKCDLVLDVVGGSTLASCWGAIKQGGVMLTISPRAGEAINPPAGAKSVAKSVWFLVEASGSDLQEIAKLLGTGRCTPVVDSVFPFLDYQAAFDRVEGGHSKGKVIIKVSD